MTKVAEMTDDEFKNLLDAYYAPLEKRSRLTSHQVMDLAERLNKKVDIPFISETGEEKLLIKIITKVDNYLYDNLPNEIYDLMHSLDHGIDDQEAARIGSKLADLANKKIDIPWIPEPAEYLAIRFVIGVVINAARKNFDYEKARDMVDGLLEAGTSEISMEALISAA